jgi:hypothetical protein
LFFQRELLARPLPSLEKKIEKGLLPMKLSLVPLLIAGKSISPEVRRALRENRLRDAAELIMKKYGLTCAEASDLLDVSVC